jgi:hypothetical protein
MVLRGGWGIYPTLPQNHLKSVKNPIICNSLIINKLLKYQKYINKYLEIWNILRIFTYIKQLNK